MFIKNHLITLLLVTTLAFSCLTGEEFSPEPAKRPVVWMDYYHHVKPGTAVGEHLVTGGWADNVGRYGWDDFSHSNSFDPLYQVLEPEFSFHLMEEPFTPKKLAEMDIAVIINPDLPEVVPTAARISDDEIKALQDFVYQGGSLLAFINSGGHPTEKFEEKQLGKLLNSFGISWNDDDTKYSNIDIGPLHPYFYDIPVFHYGAGCTLNILENATDPEVMLQVYEDKGYPDVHVDGPGLLKVRYGKGKVLVVGDTGSWGANMSRPWSENKRLLMQMFRHLKRDQEVPTPAYQEKESRIYDYKTAQLLSIPAPNNLTKLEQPGFRFFKPREKTLIPFKETTGRIQIQYNSGQAPGEVIASAEVKKFQVFDIPKQLEEDSVTINFGPLGEIASYSASGRTAKWIGPDLFQTIAFIPNKTIRVGDRWTKIQSLRIPPVVGAEVAKILPIEVIMTYMGDETVNGIECMKLRSSAYDWLNALGISVEDILPLEVTRDQWPADSIRLRANRGGRFLYRADQWISKSTGAVVKAKAQSRIAVWIDDDNKKTGPSVADIDNKLLAITSHIAEFELVNDLD